MNRTRNSEDIRAKPVPRFELIDKDGNVVGTDSSPSFLVAMAETKWPGQQQDEEDTGHGWNIRPVGRR